MTEPTFNKDSRYFHYRMDSLETKPELLTDFITPNDKFFVCKVVDSPMIDLATFSLKIGGNGVGKPFALSYDALKKLPSYTVISYLECAGNHRDLFERVMGHSIETPDDGFGMTKWLTGGVGNAVWTGVSLCTLLELAELDPDTVEVNAIGLDAEAPEGGVNRPIPIAKALDPNALVAYHMK
ncbi:MAG: molybdopterin-dependent oxidoreductase [Chloroflexota bacterium]